MGCITTLFAMLYTAHCLGGQSLSVEGQQVLFKHNRDNQMKRGCQLAIEVYTHLQNHNVVLYLLCGLNAP